MTRIRLTAVVLAAGALLWSSSARGTTITVNGGQNNSSFTRSISLIASGSSPVLLNKGCCPDYSVKGVVSGTPPEGSGELFSNALVHSNGNQIHTLFIWVTETGISAPLGTDKFHSAFTANEFVGPISSVTESTYLNPSDSVSPIGSANGEDLLGTATFGPAGGVSSTTLNMPIGTGPYALVEMYRITSTGNMGTANLTINLTATPAAVIPEPATLALLGTGLLGIAGLRRRP